MNWEIVQASGILIGSVSLVLMGIVLLFFGKRYLVAVFGATGFFFGVMLVTFLEDLVPMVASGYSPSEQPLLFLGMKAVAGLFFGGLSALGWRSSVRTSASLLVYFFMLWLRQAGAGMGFEFANDQQFTIVAVVVVAFVFIITIKARELIAAMAGAAVGTACLALGLQFITDGVVSFPDLATTQPNTIVAAVIFIIGLLAQLKMKEEVDERSLAQKMVERVHADDVNALEEMRQMIWDNRTEDYKKWLVMGASSVESMRRPQFRNRVHLPAPPAPPVLDPPAAADEEE